MCACGDYEQVDGVVWELSAEPLKVSDIGVCNAGREFDFNSEDSAVGAFDDEINVVIAVAGA